jgi:hypothetical protein
MILFLANKFHMAHAFTIHMARVLISFIFPLYVIFF